MPIRWGLCCKFLEEPIRFRTTTARYVLGLKPSLRVQKINELCLHNAGALVSAIEYCGSNGIGCFRINSQFWPLKTHPQAGYELDDLPGREEIRKVLCKARDLAASLNVRLTFHPDQFILLSSPSEATLRNSLAELEYQAEAAGLLGADVINIHAGGGYGDKPAALKRLARALKKLPKAVRCRLTLENDDRTYTPSDLLDFCGENGVPFVYDVHHHRCLPDGLDVAAVTEAAIKTWDREPLFHLSSPRGGWKAADPTHHDDFINPRDFPHEWRGLSVTIEVEAKAKEKAIFRLAKSLGLAGSAQDRR